MDDCKYAAVDVKNEVAEPEYKVTYVLGESYFNKELKKYLFPSINKKGAVIVSDTPEIEMVTKALWQITDYLYNNDIEYATIRMVK